MSGSDYEKTAQVLRDLPYRNWREFSLEDTMRYYALRLREAGLIKSNPQQLLSRGAELRFVEQLKKELKG